MYIDYDLIEDSFYSAMKDDENSSTTEEIINFSNTFTRNLYLITSQIEKDIKCKGRNTKKYVINGFELTRD